MRSAFGAGGIAFFVLLMLAGSNDVLAKFLQVEVDTLNTVLKVLLFVVPAIGGRPHLVDLPRSARSGRTSDHGAAPRRLPSQRRRRVRRGARGTSATITIGRLRDAGRSAAGMIAALALAAASCSPSFGMPRGSSTQGEEIFSLWQIFFWAAIGVAAIVYGLLGWSLFRYRRRRGDGDDALGRPFHATSRWRSSTRRSPS